MSTVQTWQTVSTSLGETLSLAGKIGSKLKGGETIELVSDLGGGKTAFVQGLATGMGSADNIHSPSFTLSNEYKAGALTLYHFDLHRLNEPGIIRDEMAEILHDSQNVVAVEWADIVKDILPAERFTIEIVPSGENSREISFSYPGDLAYLIPC